MAMRANRQVEKAEHAARHCLEDVPYRMLVLKEVNHHGVPLYLVAGSDATASGAEKALRIAHKLHGGVCFYCKKEATEITIDHAESVTSGGSDSLQNLLIACKACNAAKGHKAIEAYRPDAGREWLNALLRQVQERLNRLT